MKTTQTSAPTTPSRTRAPSPFVKALVQLVRLYQAGISSLLGRNCRFEPTCSEYMAQALTKHGLPAGLLLGVRRLLRCHPFSKGGYDPVP